MNIDSENLEQRADSDRHRHEDDLLALLLLLLHQSANRADSALSIGADPYQAAADPLTGNAMLRMPPAWPRISRRLSAADVAGFERTVRVVRTGTIEAEVGAYVPAVDYASVSRQAAARLVQHTRTAIADGIRRSFTEAKPVRRAVDEAFGAAGLVVSATNKAYLAETTVETLVGYSFNNGWFAGFARPDVAAQLKGWRFSATLDAATTEICRVRHGVKLPTGHPWLSQNTPQLHFRCRSVLLPLWHDFQATEVPPTDPPPLAGFGQAPAVVRGLSYFGHQHTLLIRCRQLECCHDFGTRTAQRRLVKVPGCTDAI